MRTISYGALIAIALGVFGYIGWSILENMRLDRQAVRAKAMRQGAAPFVALQNQFQPPPSDQDGVDGWARFDAVLNAIRIVDMAVWDNNDRPMVGGFSVTPDYTMVLDPAENLEGELKERALATGALAEKMLQAMRADGVMNKMADLASFRRALWTPDFNPDDSPLEFLLPQLGKARQLARINKARMLLAIKDDDPAEFAAAFDVVQAISRLTSLHPTLIAQLVSIAIEALGQDCVRRAIAAHPTAPWLDAIEASLARGSRLTPAEYAMRGEQVWMRETVAWYFSDIERASRGMSNGMFSTSDAPGRLGTLEENLDAIDATFEGYARMLATERPLRNSTELAALEKNRGLKLVDLLRASLGSTIRSCDQVELERRGLQTMIALERFRIRTGSYPKLLDELVPTELRSIPIDNYCGRALCYRLIDAAADPQHRGYLLYSTGADGADNGGKSPSPASSYNALNSSAGTGFDFILNDGHR